MSDPINSKAVIELSQRGVPLSTEMEEILLHDPTSPYFREHFTHLLNEVVAEINLEELAHEFTREQVALDAYDQQRFIEKQQARADEQANMPGETADQTSSSQESRQHQLTPTTITLPMLNELRMTHADYQLAQQAIEQIQSEQQIRRQQWQQIQQQEALQLVKTFNAAPVLLPSGLPLAATIALQLPANSPEALELTKRLAATPMLPDLINQPDNTDLRGLFNKQVAVRTQQLQAANPAMETDPDALTLQAREQAVKDLKLDVRQLQNKYLLSVSAIYNFLKNRGGDAIKQLVEQYNAALGIDVAKEPAHKQVGIYKIIENTIAPLLAPKLTMGNRRRAPHEELDPHVIHQLAMKGDIQAQRLKQQQLARLSTLRSLIASLRLMAESHPEYGFLHDISNQLIRQPQAAMKPFTMRMVPRGYVIK
jgi:hypothetical protein